MIGFLRAIKGHVSRRSRELHHDRYHAISRSPIEHVRDASVILTLSASRGYLLAERNPESIYSRDILPCTRSPRVYLDETFERVSFKCHFEGFSAFLRLIFLLGLPSFGYFGLCYTGFCINIER